jgi:Kef-type K+ transport system membrane component KefB
MEIFYVLLVLLIITRVFGELAVRVGQPMLVGELIAGIILGLFVQQYSSTVPVLAGLTEDHVFTAITNLGIFFLMLLGGLEMRPRRMMEESGGSLAVAASAMILPLVFGFGIAWAFIPDSNFKFAQSLFVGTGLAITAVPVAIRVLMDLGKLESRVGQVIVSAAVFDDILSLILLAILTAIIKTGGLPDIADIGVILGQMVLFFVIVVVIGLFILPRLAKLIYKYIQIDELEFSFLVIVALGFAVFAELLHIHFILGTFAAGLFFGRRTINEKVYKDVNKKISAITTGFFAPIFFASIGLHLDLSAITAIPVFLALLIFVAFITKLVGASIPAFMIGLSKRNAVAVGVAMSARGAVELIIADIALRAGLFSKPDPTPIIIDHMFSAIVIVAIVTTVAMPIILRYLLPIHQKDT